MARTGLANGARIVFSDVDGTLLDNEHRPIPASAPTIARLGAAGVPFVLVSARMPEALYPVQRALGFAGPLVCYSGAYALDERGRELLSRPMSLDVACAAKRLVARRLPGLCCMAYGYHSWVVDSRSDARVAREERIVGCESVEAGVEDVFVRQAGLHKLLLVGDPEDVTAARDLIAREFDELAAVLSSPILCEVMAKGASKAEGVRVVCAHFGLSPEQAMAAGDGHNDIDMLAAVPQSYAMANAPAEVRAAAAHVTHLPNSENGLAAELERLLA